MLKPTSSYSHLHKAYSYFEKRFCLEPVFEGKTVPCVESEKINTTNILNQLPFLKSQVLRDLPLFLIPHPPTIYEINNNYFENSLATPHFDILKAVTSLTEINSCLDYENNYDYMFNYSIDLVDSLEAFSDNFLAFDYAIKIQQIQGNAPIGIYYLKKDSIDIAKITKHFL
ncbi:hypothetical protein K9M74_05120 [Candidatus Woesearchaeota archaeon]|nr:hypothetical protein [Candidatus Woesearchaeota archaeon]